MEKKNWLETLREWTERKTGLIYTTYLITFTLFNWKFFYILFFSSDKSGSKRIAEALTEFTDRSFLQGSEYYIFQFLFPAAVTLLVINFMPILNNLAYNRFLDFEMDRRFQKSKKEAELAERIATKKREELESYETTEELQLRINNLLSEVAKLQAEIGEDPDHDNAKWKSEFNSTPNLYELMESLVETTYERSGYIYSGSTRNISAQLLSQADGLGLINISEDKRTISMTDKGKFFLNLFHSLNNISS